MNLRASRQHLAVAYSTDRGGMLTRAQAQTLESGAPSLIFEPAPAHERHIGVMTVALLALTSMTAAFAIRRAVAVAPAFIPAFAGATFMADMLTAILLFNLFRSEGSRVLLAAAAAYLLNALLIVPYALTFPGVIDRTGFIGNEQSAATLWLVWHLSFPLLNAAGMAARRTTMPIQRRIGTAATAASGCLGLALVAAVTVTAGRAHLPILVQAGNFSPTFATLTIVASLLNAACAAFIWRAAQPLSALHLWFIVALAASALDTALNVIAPVRYSWPWYIGKAQTFASASVVLIALLATWSALAERALALARRLAYTLAEGRLVEQQLRREHEIAGVLQQALLPSVMPVLECAVLSAIYRPAARDIDIGGDWYDAFLLLDGRLALTIGDVAGHGLDASIVMGKVRQSLRLAASFAPDPSQMLGIADAALRADHPDTMVTAFVALLEQRSGSLTWSSAGHPPALVRRPDGTIAELGDPAPPLGLFESVTARSNTTILEPASLLIAYTDGLVEFDHDVVGGLARVRGALSDPRVIDSTNIAARLFDTIVGEAARDDVALITLRFAGAPAVAATTRSTGVVRTP